MPKNVKLVRLKEDEQGLLVARTRTASVLVDDDFDFLGKNGGGEAESEQT